MIPDLEDCLGLLELSSVKWLESANPEMGVMVK